MAGHEIQVACDANSMPHIDDAGLREFVTAHPALHHHLAEVGMMISKARHEAMMAELGCVGRNADAYLACAKEARDRAQDELLKIRDAEDFASLRRRTAMYVLLEGLLFELTSL